MGRVPAATEPLEGRFRQHRAAPAPRWCSRPAMPTRSPASPDGRQSPADHREQGFDRPRLVADRRCPAPRLVGPDRRGPRRWGSAATTGGWSWGADGARSWSATCATSRSSPAARPPHTKRVDLVSDAPRRQPFRLGRPRRGGVLCDLAVSPLEPKAWPARELTCLEIAGGGKADDGTVAALFHDGTVRLFDARGGGGLPWITAEARPADRAGVLAGRPHPGPGVSPPARSRSATSAAATRPSTEAAPADPTPGVSPRAAGSPSATTGACG